MQIWNLKIKTHKDFLKNHYLREWLYEIEFLNHSLNRLKKWDLIVDVWANIGNHTLFWLYKGFKVFSFEPIKENYSLLIDNVINNNLEKNFTWCQYWLWEEIKEVKFIIYENNMWMCREWEWDRIVKIRKLDEFKFEPKLIKIDVEWNELQVIKWALETIKKYKPDLMVEINDEETYNFILSLWYKKDFWKRNNKNTYFITK